MGLFIRLLLIVTIVKNQAELVVASSGNQRTVSCELDLSSKIDELKSIVDNYLNMVHIELINTKDQLEEVKVTMTENQEDTRRKMDELQVAVSGNQETVSSELEDTRRKMDELQVAVSGIQGAVSSELLETGRKMDELQFTVSSNQETNSSDLEKTRRMVYKLKAAVSGNQETVSSELADTRRKTDELQVAVSGIQGAVSSELVDTRRKMDELQVAVSGNQETVSSDLVDTGRKVDELQVAVSSNQETVSSELEDTRRKMDELQVTVSGNQETVSSELDGTGRRVHELQVAVSANQATVSSEILGIRRQLEELQVSVSTLLRPDLLRKHLILNRSLRRDGNPGQCDAAPVYSTEYNIIGNINLVKMVHGPDVAGHACAMYTQAGSYLDLGDFNGTCISDPGLCEAMTWSFWLKINTSSGFTGARYYISSGGQTGLARGVALLYISAEDKFAIVVNTKHSRSFKKYNSNKIPLNSWFHVAFTIEMNQKVVTGLKLYVDGEFTHEDETIPTDSGINIDFCTKLYLGMANSCHPDYYSDPNDYCGSAAYSNLRVFDRLLNQDQIKHLKEITK